MARRRHHRRRKNPMGEDLVVGIIGAGMGALITYFYLQTVSNASAAALTPAGTAANPANAG
jgi:hypothetical protein